MIQYRTNDRDPWTKLVPTVFPDGCSQVWKVQDFNSKGISIKWNFESESEIIQLLQFSSLIRSNEEGYIKNLYIPYFPYARQDKSISNSSTFGRTTFLSLLYSMDFNECKTYDIHSNHYGTRIQNIRPDHFLKVIAISKPDVLLFPDESAMKRYQKLFEDDKTFSMVPKMYAVKKRDQKTGVITDYEIYRYKDFIDGNKVLIVDDLIDGGATFVLAAQALKKEGVTDIELCISHGVFSKGLKPLENAGIKHFYTTDSFLNGTNLLKESKNVTIYNI